MEHSVSNQGYKYYCLESFLITHPFPYLNANCLHKEYSNWFYNISCTKYLTYQLYIFSWELLSKFYDKCFACTHFTDEEIIIQSGKSFIKVQDIMHEGFYCSLLIFSTSQGSLLWLKLNCPSDHPLGFRIFIDHITLMIHLYWLCYKLVKINSFTCRIVIYLKRICRCWPWEVDDYYYVWRARKIKEASSWLTTSCLNFLVILTSKIPIPAHKSLPLSVPPFISKSLIYSTLISFIFFTIFINCHYIYMYMLLST